MIIDTHAHLNFKAYKDDADDVIRRSLANDVLMINVGSNYKTSERAVKIAERFPKGVFSAIGLHPIHTKDEDFNYEKYLELLGLKEFVPSKKTRDVYLYLPAQMLEIFTTINQFSNINLLTGESKGDRFLGAYESIMPRADGLYYGGQKLLDTGEMKIYISSAGSAISRYCEIKKDENGKTVKQEQMINPNGYLNVIYNSDKNTLLALDDSMYGSLFIQMFVLDSYDKTLFEPVIISDELKIYKLKI